MLLELPLVDDTLENWDIYRVAGAMVGRDNRRSHLA
jgi:hypothetical protein